jgi:hypothetical protein
MHTERGFAKRSMTHLSISKIGKNFTRRRRDFRLTNAAAGVLDDVLPADRELLRRLDSHLDAAAGSAEERDQDRPVRKELRERHAFVHTVRRLDHDGLIGAAA